MTFLWAEFFDETLLSECSAVLVVFPVEVRVLALSVFLELITAFAVYTCIASGVAVVQTDSVVAHLDLVRVDGYEE